MTIENAKVLQERLADEAIAQVQVQGSKELADACIHSIGIVGKAWGIPADETANRQGTRAGRTNAACWRRGSARGRSRFWHATFCSRHGKEGRADRMGTV